MKMNHHNQNEEKREQPLSPVGAYSLVRLAGPLLFISGQIPIDSQTGTLVSGSIDQQTKTVMENIKFILNTHKLKLSSVIKTSIFLTKAEDFALVNKVYGSYFQKPYPARSCVVVQSLPKGADMEIEAIAYLEKNGR